MCDACALIRFEDESLMEKVLCLLIGKVIFSSSSFAEYVWDEHILCDLSNIVVVVFPLAITDELHGTVSG